ncbi:MAG: hypothetical protein AB7O37_09820 [Vicinamibacteria bacterium]
MSDRNMISAPLAGLIVLAGALTPYLAASNVIPSDDSEFGAPRYVVAWLVIVCFFVPAVLLLGRADPAKRGGLACRWLAALAPTALALHAASHGLTRAGGVRAAWLALAALVAWLGLHHWRRLVGTFTRRER